MGARDKDGIIRYIRKQITCAESTGISTMVVSTELILKVPNVAVPAGMMNNVATSPTATGVINFGYFS